MRSVLLICIITGVGFSMKSCNNMSSSVQQKKYDSLFLGIYFGMPRQAFYDYCWEMNGKQVFTHGGIQSVEYRLIDELDRPIIMRFYPNFYEEKIYEMPVTFSYEAWAPWNKQFFADSLLVKMLPVFQKWYGEDFQTINHPVQGIVYARIDGTRRINLFIRDDQYVQAVFTDLKIERKIKKEVEAKLND